MCAEPDRWMGQAETFGLPGSGKVEGEVGQAEGVEEHDDVLRGIHARAAVAVQVDDAPHALARPLLGHGLPMAAAEPQVARVHQLHHTRERVVGEEAGKWKGGRGPVRTSKSCRL